MKNICCTAFENYGQIPENWFSCIPRSSGPSVIAFSKFMTIESNGPIVLPFKQLILYHNKSYTVNVF